MSEPKPFLATPTPLRPCPSPHKHAYRTRVEALAGFWIGSQTHPHHPYLCRCGYWHITSHSLI
jgi:hypothetical protein